MFDMMVVLQGLGVVIGLYVLYGTIIFIQGCIKLRAFKGPFALPIFGCLLNPGAAAFLGYLVKMRRKFGRVYSYFAFNRSYLVICEPAAVRRILSDSKTFPKGADYSNQFSAVFGEGLVTATSDKHKKDRSSFNRLFIRSSVSKYCKIINEMATSLMDEKLKIGSNNFADFYAILALRTFMQFSLSHTYKDDPKREEHIAKIVSKGSAIVGFFVVFGIPIRSWVPGGNHVLNIIKEIMADCYPLVDKRRKEMEAGTCTVDDCLTVMIEEKMSYKDIQDHLITLVCAGHDTTAYFSAYITYLLAKYPECQDKVRSEMEKVMGDRTEVTADDVYEMKYLQNVMKETLRFYAIIPCVSRHSTREMEIKEANLTIPANTDVLIPMFVMNRDPELWEDASEFKPERWEGKGNDFTAAGNGFFPFGYGTRTCIGNTLAYMESTIFLTHLLRRYRVEPEPGFKPAVLGGISLVTSNGVHCILKEL